MLPEFGGVELLAIAALALIIVGPKDLPVLLRKVGKFVGKMRGMAQEFRASFDEMARQSELDELRKEVEAMRLAQTYDPTGLVPGAYGVQPGVETAVEPEPAYLPGSHADGAVAPEPDKPAAPARKPRAAKPATAKGAKAKPPVSKAAAKPKTAGKAKAPARTRARKETVR
jgi:sec-independent protein translocase protein TatB